MYTDYNNFSNNMKKCIAVTALSVIHFSLDPVSCYTLFYNIILHLEWK